MRRVATLDENALSQHYISYNRHIHDTLSSTKSEIQLPANTAAAAATTLGLSES